MRTTHTRVIVTLLTVAAAGCFTGTGSGLMGIAGGNGGGNGAPPVLSFFVQPNSANVGRVISPPVEVVARDSLGSTNTSFNGSITIGLASNPTGASLGGTTLVRASNGLATFNNLAVDKVGTYTLQASASGAATVTSTAFSITTVTAP